MTKGKTVQKMKEKEQDITLRIEIDISRQKIELLNRLGLKDNVKRMLWSDIIADSIENLYHDNRYLGCYVKAGAELEEESGKESPKMIIIPAELKAADYVKYLERCRDIMRRSKEIGGIEISKQAGEDLAGLGRSHCMPEG